MPWGEVDSSQDREPERVDYASRRSSERAERLANRWGTTAGVLITLSAIGGVLLAWQLPGCLVVVGQRCERDWAATLVTFLAVFGGGLLPALPLLAVRDVLRTQAEVLASLSSKA